MINEDVVKNSINDFLSKELSLNENELPKFSFVLNNDDQDSEIEYAFWVFESDSVSYFYPESNSFQWNGTTYGE